AVARLCFSFERPRRQQRLGLLRRLHQVRPCPRRPLARPPANSSRALPPPQPHPRLVPAQEQQSQSAQRIFRFLHTPAPPPPPQQRLTPRNACVNAVAL